MDSNTLLNRGHLEYRGLRIQQKLDFGRQGNLDDAGKPKGWLVTDGMCNVLPGATWAHTIEGAVALVDDYILAGGHVGGPAPGNVVTIDPPHVAEAFWRLVRARQATEKAQA